MFMFLTSHMLAVDATSVSGFQGYAFDAADFVL